MNSKNTEKAKCLLCDKFAAVRGLCRSHYETYRKNRELAEDQEAFEREAVARGLIVAEDKRKASNPFAELREELEAKAGESVAAEVKESYRQNTKKKPKP